MEKQGFRLKEIRVKLGLSQEEFGRRLGLSRAAIAAVEGGKNKFSQDVLCKLILTFNVNLNFLIAGIGDMFISEKSALKYEDAKADILKEVEKMLKERGL